MPVEVKGNAWSFPAFKLQQQLKSFCCIYNFVMPIRADIVFAEEMKSGSKEGRTRSTRRAKSGFSLDVQGRRIYRRYDHLDRNTGTGICVMSIHRSLANEWRHEGVATPTSALNMMIGPSWALE